MRVKPGPKRRPDCLLSNMVEAGGRRQHYGDIVDGVCSACGLTEDFRDPRLGMTADEDRRRGPRLPRGSRPI